MVWREAGRFLLRRLRRGRGTMRSMVEGARARTAAVNCPLHRPPGGPPPPLKRGRIQAVSVPLLSLALLVGCSAEPQKIAFVAGSENKQLEPLIQDFCRRKNAE